MDWQPIRTAPTTSDPVLVHFKGAKFPIVAFRTSPDAEEWIRYLGFGKNTSWPAIHQDYAEAWMPLPQVTTPAPTAE